jgi:hypothetical protein
MDSGTTLDDRCGSHVGAAGLYQTHQWAANGLEAFLSFL